MANIKSAIKRIRVNDSKRERNKPVKSALATEIKKFRTAVEGNELKHAEELLKEVFSALDSAAAENIIHKNKADREKARLSKLLSAKQNKKAPKKEAAKPAAQQPADKAAAAAKPAVKTAAKPAAAKKAPAKKPAAKGAKK